VFGTGEEDVTRQDQQRHWSQYFRRSVFKCSQVHYANIVAMPYFLATGRTVAEMW